MATQEQINQIDNSIAGLATAYSNSFKLQWDEFLLAWSQLDDPYDRVAVFGLLADLRDQLAVSVNQTDAISQAMLTINDSTKNINAEVAGLKSTAYSQNNIALEDEVNAVMLLLLAAGSVSAISILLAQRNNNSIVNRIKRTFDLTVIQLSSQITRILGSRDPSTKYKYVGGIIPNTRPFCARHNNAVYTLTEINNIWNSSWEGKAPGDPFAVRGGYNCRHFWILEK